MKAKIFLSLLLLAGAGAMPAAPPGKIVGDYVEARTASVFAGACHYNGELVTTGRDAVMAWNISAGSWNGIDLAGVKAMAAVNCETSLGNDKAPRHCELVVDTSATPAQTAAVVDFVRAQSGKALGPIVSLRRTPITFTDRNRAYHVEAAGFACLAVQPMPNDECCAQPNLVWYSPLVHLDHRKVGFTQTASYLAGTIGDAWEQSGDNSAFYGSFSY